MLSALFVWLICADFAAPARAQSIFAHVIVGNTYSYTQDDWARDIEIASNASIDGFALNIGYLDTINSAGFVQSQLDHAYQAADAAGNFHLFLSFDYLAQGAWDQNAVIETINSYSWHPSQSTWEGKPLASTFEGPGNADDWGYIKSQTNCFFIPDFSSQGAFGAAAKPNVDGLLSWNAWPTGANDMTDGDDQAYVTALGDRPYMMPVAPWFYTNLPQWSKNWLWRGDDLWHDRWEQVAQIQPTLVEILTWNDWGECSVPSTVLAFRWRSFLARADNIPQANRTTLVLSHLPIPPSPQVQPRTSRATPTTPGSKIFLITPPNTKTQRDRMKATSHFGTD